MLKKRNGNELQIRTVRLLPEDLELTPSFPQDLEVREGVSLTLTTLFGLTEDGGRRVDSTTWNALKVSTYGSAYRRYSSKTGNAPLAYSTAHELAAAGGFYHRWDFLIESQEAAIRFYQDTLSAWGSDIPLTVGNHSIEFSSSKCQIKYRSAAGGAYTIIGYS